MLNIKFYNYLLLIGIISFAYSCRNKEEPPGDQIVRPIKTMLVGEAEGIGRNYPGNVQASQRVNLSFRVSGPLIELPVKEGEFMEKGSKLAKIDPRDYYIALNEAKARQIEAQADYDRYRDLYERDAVSKADLDVRRAKRDTADAKMDIATAHLKDTVLKAPFSGRIGEKYVDNFEKVLSGQHILSLQDITHVEIVIDLPENVVARLQKGMNIEYTANYEAAPEKEFAIVFKEISAQADPTTQTYKATFTMPSPDDLTILPGMTANVVITGFQESPLNSTAKFVIPAYAVIPGDGDQQYVWIVNKEDLTVQKRQVKVGEVVGSEGIYILDGIDSGEMVALTGVTQLNEGMKVRLLGNEQ